MKIGLTRTGVFLMLAFLLVVLCGCTDSGKGTTTKSIPSDQLQHLVIETGAHDIVIRSSDAETLSASVEGYKGELLTQEQDTVLIAIPMPGGGIHLRSPQPLYVDLPRQGIVGSLTVRSEYGQVRLEAVSAAEISVTTEHGNIALSGVSGQLTAKTKLGDIRSALELEQAIVTGTDGIGAFYEGPLLDKESSQIIELSTEFGQIELQ